MEVFQDLVCYSSSILVVQFCALAYFELFQRPDHSLLRTCQRVLQCWLLRFHCLVDYCLCQRTQPSASASVGLSPLQLHHMAMVAANRPSVHLHRLPAAKCRKAVLQHLGTPGACEQKLGSCFYCNVDRNHWSGCTKGPTFNHSVLSQCLPAFAHFCDWLKSTCIRRD